MSSLSRSPGKGAELLSYHNVYIIHLFTVGEQLYGGFSPSQDRMYGDMFCMCTDIGYGGTGENKRVQ
jgi:hypothetical protein